MENEFVRWLTNVETADALELPDGSIGIGDDAALLPGVDRGIVVTTDLLADGLHFELPKHGAWLAGRKSLAVNLSDLAAMACTPMAVVVSLLLPRDNDVAQIARGCMQGIYELAGLFKTKVVGGDTNVGGDRLVISVTAIGTPTDRGPLRRNSAQVGDIILVTGPLGGSILGHHLHFQPRVHEALRLHRDYDLHAGMDISDGLAMDLGRMTESSGVGAELWLDQIPVSEAAVQLSVETGRSALEHALGDGEDFELLFTVPEAEARRILQNSPLDEPVFQVGRIIEGSGLLGVDAKGSHAPLQPSGFQHGVER